MKLLNMWGKQWPSIYFAFSVALHREIAMLGLVVFLLGCFFVLFCFFFFEQGILLHQSEFDMKCVERQNTYSYE